MADTNRLKLRFARETDWGETVSNPASTEMRITRESLSHDKTTVVSNELRSDRQRAAVLEVGQAASGDIEFELTYGEFESFIETALRGTLASATVADSSTTFAASSITAPEGTNFVASFEAGQWIKVQATSDANDDAVVQIVSLSSTVLTVTGSTLTVSVGASANITGRTIKNSTTKTSYFLEADFIDVTAVKYFNGMSIDQMSLNIASQQIVTGVFSFMGKQGFTSSATVASTVVTSAGTTTPMTAAVNVAEIYEGATTGSGGTKLSDAVQSLTLRIANNMRARPKVGSKQGIQHGDGGVDVTGQVNVYFESKSLLDKLIAHTESSIAFQLKDLDGNFIVVTIPSLYFSQGAPATPGQDQDVFLPLDWVARADPTDSFTVRFDFLDA